MDANTHRFDLMDANTQRFETRTLKPHRLAGGDRDRVEHAVEAARALAGRAQGPARQGYQEEPALRGFCSKVDRFVPRMRRVDF